MKIGIIGGGISGLTIGRLLSKFADVEIFEKNNFSGGIAHVKDVHGIPYHVTGGHCFNSKDNRVLDFIFNEVLPKTQWHQIQRKAKINLMGNLVNYPIEFAIKEIAAFDINLALKMTSDFFSAPRNGGETLDNWFINHFGQTMAQEYFLPYNAKIWARDLSNMDSHWVKDKLPIPSVKDFFIGLIQANRDSMPHSSFFYPNANTQNRFIEALAEGLSVTYSYQVKSIEKTGHNWLINGESSFDKIISTAPLKELPSYIVHCPSDIIAYADQLQYNCVTTILWKTIPGDATWIYYPSKSIPFHRQINIGNFLHPTLNACITETIGCVKLEKILNDDTEPFGFIEKIDYNISDYAYVVFDRYRNRSVENIKKYLDDIGLITLGRFGEWDYYNMDICIRKTMDLAAKIKSDIHAK